MILLHQTLTLGNHLLFRCNTDLSSFCSQHSRFFHLRESMFAFSSPIKIFSIFHKRNLTYRGINGKLDIVEIGREGIPMV